MKLNKNLLTLFSIGVSIFFFSCKKLDTSQESNVELTNINFDKFFNSHRTRDSKENAIVKYVMRINEKKNL